MMKKFKGLKSLATKLHSWFHLSLDGKKPKHKADYYDVAFAHFEKRCESIEKKIDKLSKRQQKRAPSAFNVFMGKRMSEGTTMQEAAKEWKEKV